MNKRLPILLAPVLACMGAFGQTAASNITTAAPVSGTPAASTFPGYLVGAGPSWTRGGTYPYSFDSILAVHIGQGQWYSWTDISTPMTMTPGGQPVTSSITTGGAWVPVQSSSGAVSLIFIVQAGFSALQASSTVAPAFTGSMGVDFRLGKRGVHLMPYAKAGNASTSASSGALATAVFQPGLMVMYGFGGK